MKTTPTIGVLALQGAVEPHRPHIEAAGATFMVVKTPEEFDAVDAFILPGGESTTMLKLIEAFDLWESLARNFKTKPVWGVCAGVILLAEKVTVRKGLSSRTATCPAKPEGRSRKLEGSGTQQPDPSSQAPQDDRWEMQKSFGLLPIEVERNGYGRQLQSHHDQVDGYPVSYIRAPIITKVNGDVKILAKEEDKPVWLRRGRVMATTFHPELTLDFPSPMHRAFIDMTRQVKLAA